MVKIDQTLKEVLRTVFSLRSQLEKSGIPSSLGLISYLSMLEALYDSAVVIRTVRKLCRFTFFMSENPCC